MLPNPTTEEVLELFEYRCPCRMRAHTVHELIPRSRGSRSNGMQNRTAICLKCHDEFHSKGSSETSIGEWRQKIFIYLSSIGKWDEYINYGKK